MREITTEIEIHAPANKVWSVLTNLGRFPRWNPFIRKAEGEIREGARLTVRIEPPGGRGMTFKPTVTRVHPQRELRWLGHLWIAGLFDGEHLFEIVPAGEQGVRFVQRERFSGLLVPLLWRSVEQNTRRGFIEMNAALKERAEQGAPGGGA